MQPTPPSEGPLGQAVILALASILFSGVPFAYLGFTLTRRFRLKQERAVLFGALGGAVIAVLLMWWLRNAGAIAAFCGMVGWFYGAWYGGKNHLVRSPSKPVRHKSGVKKTGYSASRKRDMSKNRQEGSR